MSNNNLVLDELYKILHRIIDLKNNPEVMSHIEKNDPKGFRTYYDKKKIDMMYDGIINPYKDFYKNQSIVDVGCNSGLMTYALSCFAKKSIGVERGNNSWSHIEEVTSKLLKDNLYFFHMSVGDFFKSCDEEYDMIFASQVLYYLSPEELSLLKHNLSEKCSKAMLISSETRTGVFKSMGLENANGLHSSVNISKLLNDCGFDVEFGEEIKGTTSEGNRVHWIPVMGNKQ